jgi:hypothetical protein
LGKTAMLDDASIGDNNVGADGLVSAIGLLLFFVQELKIKIESNANINMLLMAFAPGSEL